MSQQTGRAKHAVQAPPKKPKRKAGTFDPTLLIRLVIAIVIFAVALILKTPVFVKVILLIISALAAGYDIFLEAIDSVEEGDYFANSLIVICVAVIGFVIGYPTESAALVILYQLGVLAIAYAGKRTRASALALVNGQDDEIKSRVKELVESKEADPLKIEKVMRSSAGLVLRAAMIFAAVYAIVLPLFSSFPFRVSIHRALMIILVCTPASIVAAMPLAGIVGIGQSASKGILFGKSSALEKAANIKTAVFDKAGIFSADSPEVLKMESSVLDDDTFLNFAAHAAYYSDQPFAKAISDIYDQEYKLDVVSDFKDLSGYGVELKIGGTPVLLATGEYLASRGANVPKDPSDKGQPYYLIIAGRYIGKILISANVNAGTEGLLDGMAAAGVQRCVLLTEDGQEESRRIAEDLGFSEFIAETDTMDKLAYLSKLSAASPDQVMYVYSNGFENHSDAALDVRVSTKGKYADALVAPELVANLPEAVKISRRLHDVAVENAVFAFVIKAILIFLSVIGCCTLWFAMFLDTAATLATILNTIRVTKDSKFFRASDDDEDEEE